MKGMRRDSLFFRIAITVLIGVAALAAVLGSFQVRLTRRVFMENFSESQDKIFAQIDADFYAFYEDVAEILQGICQNPMVIRYMRGVYPNQAEEWLTIQSMETGIQEMGLDAHTELGLLLVGVNGGTYLYSSPERMAVSAEEILQTAFCRKVLENPRLLASTYLESGYTDVMRNEPVVLFAKAIQEQAGGEADGIAFLTIKESEFRKLYQAFVSKTSNILIFNRENELISAGNPKDFLEPNQQKAREILEEMEAKNVRQMDQKLGDSVKSYQIQRFLNTSYKMLGVIDSNAAFEEEYHVFWVAVLTAGIAALVMLVLFYLVRAQTRPLHRLAETMRSVGDGNLEAYVEEEGVGEVRELSRTYNGMITKLRQYIARILEMEEEKRKLESMPCRCRLIRITCTIPWPASSG
ncbi:MAG: HAMP domain-containing protein [Eubacteriales bacterium]|nr:HAMP domain-containing protein [Eubacteriales bacterium]